jgi:hypothetical protein
MGTIVDHPGSGSSAAPEPRAATLLPYLSPADRAVVALLFGLTGRVWSAPEVARSLELPLAQVLSTGRRARSMLNHPSLGGHLPLS